MPTARKRFVEIPVRDDATEFSSAWRGFQVLDALSRVKVSVSGKDVIDLGAGFGSLSLAAAARNSQSVTALDVHPTRLAAVSERAEAANVKIRTVTANLLDPSSQEPQADVGLMFGVVEYAGLWDLSVSPLESQAKLLRSARTYIREGGCLVLGTKNRTWPGFIFRDVHTSQPLVNSVPRKLADVLSKHRFGQPYRHHLHSARAWQSLVLAAGFSSAEIHVPFFSYQFPIYIVTKPRLRDAASIRRLAKDVPKHAEVTGRAVTLKLAVMVLSSLLRIPTSQSIIIIAHN